MAIAFSAKSRASARLFCCTNAIDRLVRTDTCCGASFSASRSRNSASGKLGESINAKASKNSFLAFSEFS